MTDKQIRDRIVGVLSASMMPMETEAECVAFLNRCLTRRDTDAISRKKTVRDLRGIQDVLMAQGDPFLAGVLNRAIACVEHQPAVVGSERPSGRWEKSIDNETVMHKCSECGARVVKGMYEYENPNRFCYHCGAKMDRGENNAM